MSAMMARRAPATSSPEPEPRKIDAQGRLHLPPDILEMLKAKPGDYLAFRVTPDGVQLYKVRWVPDDS